MVTLPCTVENNKKLERANTCMKTQKAQQNKITILGSGTSTGVPMLGCSCPICLSKNPKDKRYRTSFVIHTAHGKNILIDTTPDMRSQLLENRIKNIDTAIITHEHADHLHGIDDLRPFCFTPNHHTIPIHTSKICGQVMRERYPYIFHWEKFYNKDKPIIGGGIPRLDLELIDVPKKGFIKKTIEGLEFHFFLLPHGYGETMGFMQGKFAYLVDCHFVPDHIIKFLNKQKLDLLMIDCTQEEKHESHLTIETSFSYIKAIRPKRAGLIHMNHFLAHNELSKTCKKHFSYPVGPLYDRQKLYY